MIDPRLAVELNRLVDQRVEQLMAKQPRVAYGVVDSVSGNKAAVNV